MEPSDAHSAAADSIRPEDSVSSIGELTHEALRSHNKRLRGHKWDPELPAVPAFTEKVLCCGGDSRDASQAGATTVVAMDAVSQGLGTSSAG